MVENTLTKAVEKYYNCGLKYVAETPLTVFIENFLMLRVYSFDRLGNRDKRKFLGYVDEIQAEIDGKIAFTSTIEVHYEIETKFPMIDFESVPRKDIIELIFSTAEKRAKTHFENLSSLIWDSPVTEQNPFEWHPIHGVFNGWALEEFGTVSVINNYIQLPPKEIGSTIDLWGPMATQKAWKLIKRELKMLPEDGCFSPREVKITGSKDGKANLVVEITKVCCDNFEDKIREIISKHTRFRDLE